MQRPGSSFLMDAGKSGRPDSAMSTNINMADQQLADSKKKTKCQLPWWFVIVGWILLYAAVLVSAAFVTFYGIQFQDIKCKKWITSMIISFITSIFFTQPIKVMPIIYYTDLFLLCNENFKLKIYITQLLISDEIDLGNEV